ncbi:hypothetical protein ACQKFS_03080 [Pseudomonas guineae]|uniref:hypothetical protein n=1 Tax=Pseudomonas guineae TaxID=425504 RepID=UPI003CFC93FD
MSKKKKGDKVFTIATMSPVIAEFQKLANMGGGEFPWTKMVSQEETRFIYDMLSAAETQRHFIPTTAQAKWGAQILLKLRGTEHLWKPTSAPRSKKLSTRADLLARRKAKEHLKSLGVVLEKASPSNVELVKMLNVMGEIEQTPTRASAKALLITWNTAQRSSKSVTARQHPQSAATPPPQPATLNFS